MSKIINMQEYKDNEFEKMFFLYYKHVEDFFEEKADETSVMTRLYFGIRYVEGLSNVFAKYKKEDLFYDAGYSGYIVGDHV